MKGRVVSEAVIGHLVRMGCARSAFQKRETSEGERNAFIRISTRAPSRELYVGRERCRMVSEAARRRKTANEVQRK